MASTIEERILDLLAAALATITIPNGHEQTVVTVKRASQEPAAAEFTAAQRPALQIRHIQTQGAPHLRGALECVMDLQIICAVAEDSTDEAMADLIASVQKVLMANERWDAGGGTYLARRTWITGSVKHETEIGGESVDGMVSFSIKYRADSTNLYASKEV